MVIGQWNKDTITKYLYRARLLVCNYRGGIPIPYKQQQYQINTVGHPKVWCVRKKCLNAICLYKMGRRCGYYPCKPDKY